MTTGSLKGWSGVTAGEGQTEVEVGSQEGRGRLSGGEVTAGEGQAQVEVGL